jgi:acyl-CoA thioester hydrolase
VRFAETDAQGVAHHAAYLVWFETARVEYLRRFAGGYQALRDTGVEATTSEVHARYIRARRLRRPIVIHTRCTEMSGARFKYEHERNGEPVADG